MSGHSSQTHVTSLHQWNDGSTVVGMDGGYMITLPPDTIPPKVGETIVVSFAWSSSVPNR